MTSATGEDVIARGSNRTRFWLLTSAIGCTVPLAYVLVFALIRWRCYSDFHNGYHRTFIETRSRLVYWSGYLLVPAAVIDCWVFDNGFSLVGPKHYFAIYPNDGVTYDDRLLIDTHKAK